MSLIHSSLLLGAGAAAGGYQIERSIRFNSSDSAFCSRVAVAPTDATKFTLSFWVKRSKLGAEQVIMYAGSSASDKLDRICFLSNDTIELRQRRSNVDYTTTTSAVFRDCSAWYHIVYSWSTGTRTLYVNGVSQAFASNSTTTSTHYWQTSGITQYLGRDNNEGGSPYAYGDFYLADIHFIDGQALTPSSFTEVSATTGQLIPKAYTGSFGTNGFWLKFSDNSAATATTLGKDYSGNSNNWTPNNLSVTAGAGNDSLVDTPTSYGTDTGAGGEVRGNYSTLSPITTSGQGLATLTNGNLDISGTGSNYTGCVSTIAMPNGKWYWEYTVTAYGSVTGTGIVSTASLSGAVGGYYGYAQVSDGWFRTDTTVTNNAAYSVTGLSSISTNDVINVAVDVDAGKIWFGRNGTWESSGNPASGTNATVSFTPGGKSFYALAQGFGTWSGVFNAGARSFAYTAPSGFKALCDTNLTSTTITTSGSYTGNGVADGPFVYLNGVPTAMTIGGNAVTFGTHADKLSNGFKIRTSSTTYNQNASSYSYSITSTGAAFKNARAQPNP